ncbi:MAG: hypothetical protein AAFV45_11100 [Pseudomonadota bacterium]
MLLSSDIAPPAPRAPKRALTEVDAVEVWISRWLRHRRADIVRRFGCDPRRVYEIWEGKRYPASRERALKEFKTRYPELLDRVDFGNHRRIPRITSNDPAQLALFE